MGYGKKKINDKFLSEANRLKLWSPQIPWKLSYEEKHEAKRQNLLSTAQDHLPTWDPKSSEAMSPTKKPTSNSTKKIISPMSSRRLPSNPHFDSVTATRELIGRIWWCTPWKTWQLFTEKDSRSWKSWVISCRTKERRIVLRIWTLEIIIFFRSMIRVEQLKPEATSITSS